jgi:hypothetical protein
VAPLPAVRMLATHFLLREAQWSAVHCVRVHLAVRPIAQADAHGVTNVTYVQFPRPPSPPHPPTLPRNRHPLPIKMPV